MVLLDLLRKQKGVELIVAHLDHGIRDNSQQDRKLVENVAMSHNMIFEYREAALGPTASEEAAREARYLFLRHICKKYNALALITAHHQDDLLETAFINLLRGTGRRGLSSLRSTSETLRPLLQVSKAAIVEYALKAGLVWSEDSTNQDQKYLRNYVRHSLITKLSREQRENLLGIIVRQSQLNQEIDILLNNILNNSAQVDPDNALPRYLATMLPDPIAYELMQLFIMGASGRTVERGHALRALHFAKTAKIGKSFDLNKKWALMIKKRGQIIVVPKQAC